MVYWVIISAPDGTVIRRRPHGSEGAAEEYAVLARQENEGCAVEIRLLPRGVFPK